jgi:hypothetical protein
MSGHGLLSDAQIDSVIYVGETHNGVWFGAVDDVMGRGFGNRALGAHRRAGNADGRCAVVRSPRRVPVASKAIRVAILVLIRVARLFKRIYTWHSRAIRTAV